MDRPTLKRREREREARRQAILDAAARVFSRKTFYEATLDEIAAEAELAKGTLYNYYKDKQDIFISLVEKRLGEFQERLDEAIASSQELPELLEKCFETSLAMVRDHRYMYRLMITAGAHLSEKVRADVVVTWHRQSILAAQKLATALASFPETRKLSDDDRQTGSRLTFSAIHDLHHRQMIEGEPGALKKEIKNYVRLLVRALTLE